MPTLKMTDAAVKSAPAAPGDRKDYFDSHPRDRVRGLVLRVSGATEGRPEGSRVWAVLYRVKGDKKLRRLTIGEYPTFSLADARAEADEVVRSAKRGVDVIHERREAAEVKRAADEKRCDDAIETIVANFISRHLERKKRAPRYIEETRRNFDNHVLSRWRGRDIGTITRREVAELLDAIAEKGSDVTDEDGAKRHVDGGPIAANRTLAAVRALFNWALKRGIINSTPVALVDKPGEETERERALDNDEVRTLWPRFKGIGYPFGHFLCFALATGQRRSEVAALRETDIDEKARTWTIPKEFTKAKREHVVPLSELALEILSDARDMAKALAKATAEERAGRAGVEPPKVAHEPGPYLFSTVAGAKPISGYSKSKSALDAAVVASQKKAGRKNLEHWTIHDLRRTCATGMAKLGVDRLVIGRVLNHADNTVTGIYDRHAYLPEKRDALEKWGRHLASLTRPRLATGRQRGAA